ncbi:MAG: hypothetical protein M3R61_16505, partial [Chloroflexota bacterium]|nr:hypothetical protein [Chloroflexota bacterium]
PMAAFCEHHQSDHDQESLVERLYRVAAQPAVPADRCAHKIVGFLKVLVMRSRQLNGNPLGGQAKNVASRSRTRRIAIHASAVSSFPREVYASGADTHASLVS